MRLNIPILFSINFFNSHFFRKDKSQALRDILQIGEFFLKTPIVHNSVLLLKKSHAINISQINMPKKFLNKHFRNKMSMPSLFITKCCQTVTSIQLH